MVIINKDTKECHVTESECAHNQCGGNIDQWCPCPSGWEKCGAALYHVYW